MTPKKEESSFSIEADNRTAKCSELCVWRSVALISVVIGGLFVTGISFYFFAVAKCGTSTSGHTVSVTQGEPLMLSHRNKAKIEYCSVQTPVLHNVSELHHSRQNESMDTLKADNEILKVKVLGNRCDVYLDSVMMKHNGVWTFFVGLSRKYFERNRYTYNVSVVENEELLFSTTARAYKENLNTLHMITSFHLTKSNRTGAIKPHTMSFSPSSTATTFSIPSNTVYRNCPFEWTMYKNGCYKLFNNNVYIEREEASNICKDEASYLASIKSINEQKFVSNYIRVHEPEKKIWIGGRKYDVWKWDEGDEFDYTNWYPHEPNNGVDCIYMNHLKNYSWHDASCGADGRRWGIFVFLCKKPVPY